jgi:hypothetical protein
MTRISREYTQEPGPTRKGAPVVTCTSEIAAMAEASKTSPGGQLLQSMKALLGFAQPQFFDDDQEARDSRTAAESQRARSLCAAGRAEHLRDVWGSGLTVQTRQRDEDQGTRGEQLSRVTRSTSNMTMKWKGLTGGVEIVHHATPLPSITLTAPAVLEEPRQQIYKDQLMKRNLRNQVRLLRES